MSKSSQQTFVGSPQRNALPADVAQAIFAAIAGLRFGSVEITVHDCKVVQIERKEKFRFVPNKASEQ